MIEQKFHYRSGMWYGLEKATNILCSDGQYRTFYSTNGDADSFFTHPGHITVKGKTVTGFIWHDSLLFENNPNHPDGVWKFSANSWMKNARMLPEWPSTKKDYLYETLPASN